MMRPVDAQGVESRGPDARPENDLASLKTVTQSVTSASYFLFFDLRGSRESADGRGGCGSGTAAAESGTHDHRSISKGAIIADHHAVDFRGLAGDPSARAARECGGQAAARGDGGGAGCRAEEHRGCGR